MPVAVIYGANSKSIRRIIVDDEEGKLAQHVGAGEGIVIIGKDVEGHAVVRTVQGDQQVLFRGVYPNLEECEAIVEQVTGVKPMHSRCLVVGPTGLVDNSLMADPDLDVVPGKLLVRAATKTGPETIGDHYSAVDQKVRRNRDGKWRTLEYLSGEDAAIGAAVAPLGQNATAKQIQDAVVKAKSNYAVLQPSDSIASVLDATVLVP